MSEIKKQNTKTLVLLDAHAIIHRAYHALPEFLSSAGEPTGALYGLSSMLMKIITELKPDIFEIMDEIPIKEIARDLGATARGMDRLVNSSDLSGIFFELRDTLRETNTAMRSFGLLSEYLEQHPESLLKGKGP